MHAIDTEYVANAPGSIPPLVSVGIAGTSGCRLFHQSDPDAPDAIRDIFRDRVAFAMAPTDIVEIWSRWPALLGEIITALDGDRVVDVLTNEKLIDIAEGEYRKRGRYGLAAVAYRRAGIELAKGDDTFRMHYGTLLHVPVALWPAAATQYALDDPAATFAVWAAQEAFREANRAPGIDVLADAHRQVRAHLVLFLQTLRGIHTDPVAVAALAHRLDTEIARLEQRCIANGLARIGGTKAAPRVVRNTKVAAKLIEDIAISTGQIVPLTEKGKVSLAEEALNELHIPSGHPLDDYRKLGSIKTLRSGWVEPLSHPLVRTHYDECVSSGRTSSSGFDDGHTWEPCSRNLQNFPKEHTLEKLGIGDADFRGCLVPRPGYAFVISDFSALELVTLAQVQLDWFGRSALADALRDPKRGDPHGEFGAEMLGVPYPADSRLPPGPGEFNKKLKAHKDARQGAKAFNFGKPGGMGAKRFIAHARDDYGVDLTPQEERRLTASWQRKWPEMKLFFDRVSEMEDRHGYITISDNRSGRIRGRMRFPDGCNTNFQGRGADVAKAAMWLIFLACIGFGEGGASNPLYGCALVLFVHDENVLEAPIDRAPAALAEQERLMKLAALQFCPDVPIGVESTISDRYSK